MLLIYVITKHHCGSSVAFGKPSEAGSIPSLASMMISYMYHFQHDHLPYDKGKYCGKETKIILETCKQQNVHSWLDRRAATLESYTPTAEHHKLYNAKCTTRPFLMT